MLEYYTVAETIFIINHMHLHSPCHLMYQGWHKSKESEPSMKQGDELEKPQESLLNPSDFRISEADVHATCLSGMDVL